MKKIFLILLVSFSFSKCKNNNETEFDSSRIENINEIVRTVILEDSLNVLRNEKESKMFCEELLKQNIYVPKKRKENEPVTIPMPFLNNISIENLLYHKIENEIFFTTKDSLFLLQQNLNPQTLKIEEEVVEKINSTTKEKEINKKKLGESYNFYEMTIPIFSSDNQKAYLELNHYCGGLCGSGKSIFLKKINGKWKIIDKWRTWIS